MRAKYKSICVKFREDDPAQLAVWKHLQSRVGAGHSYGAIIAEMYAAQNGDGKSAPEEPPSQIMEVLGRLERICLDIQEQLKGCAPPPPHTSGIGESVSRACVEDTKNDMQLAAGIASVVLSLGDEDD